MELIKKDFTAVKTTETARYERTDYTLGSYSVSHCFITYADGTTRERFDIKGEMFDVAGQRRYLPEIYFDDGFYGEDKKWFEIQTTSYGALTPDKIKEVVAGYEQALEAVAILTKEFIK